MTNEFSLKDGDEAKLHSWLGSTALPPKWLNVIEGWFAQLERRTLYRETFTSVTELKSEIKRFIKVHNQELAKLFKRTKTTEKIIASVERAKQALPN